MARKINYKTSLSASWRNPTSVNIHVYGKVTVLKEKAQETLRALRALVPGMVTSHISTWQFIFDCDRLTDSYTIVAYGVPVEAIRAAVETLQKG